MSRAGYNEDMADQAQRQRPAVEFRSVVAPRPPRADLGPNQLEWLRKNVGSFGICERLAVESEAHRQRLLAEVRP